MNNSLSFIGNTEGAESVEALRVRKNVDVPEEVETESLDVLLEGDDLQSRIRSAGRLL